MRTILCFALGVAAVFVVGCQQANPWKDNFKRQGIAQNVYFPPTDTIQIRVVTTEQMDAALRSSQDYLAAKNLAIEDATAADRMEMHKAFLHSLRIPDPPETVLTIGKSASQGPYQADPDDPRLREVAMQHGSSFVVFVSQYLGTKLGYRSVPTTGIGTVNNFGQPFGNSGSFVTTLGTTPVSVEREEWQGFALFYRRVSPEQFAEINRDPPK